MAGSKVRCAIYTRKSSDEGLEQDFNSLDAQREACAAYVLSQASEGWVLVQENYDDGGISGGTLERPALQRLLADISEGRIDIVVVYKVDRLTRSLLDFAKLVEAFDRAGASFVSVTQSFNTTTSMGRLTLNMLLSFAQFEREVTAERIRDKIAASKARGMWMGGVPPLGYKPDGRTLAIVDEHAALVRDIFRRYLTLGNVRLVAEQLAGENIRSPGRIRRDGRIYGGHAFSRGQIYSLLGNPVYTGRIAHKGRLYPGLHPAIIDQALWDEVQQRLTAQTRDTARTRSPTGSLLAGKLYDAAGDLLIAAHATKGTVRYRYYVSKALHHGGDIRGGDAGGEITNTGTTANLQRLPAREIEQVVIAELAALFDDPLALAAGSGLTVPPDQLAVLGERSAHVAARLRARDPTPVQDLLERVSVTADGVDIAVRPAAIASLLGLPFPDTDIPVLHHHDAIRLTRTGRAIRLVQDNGGFAVTTHADSSLVRLVARARHWWGLLQGGDIDIRQLSNREGVTASYMTRVVRLAFLSPAVVEAIMRGELRAGVDGITLFASGAIPERWDAQAARMLPISAAAAVGVGGAPA